MARRKKETGFRDCEDLIIKAKEDLSNLESNLSVLKDEIKSKKVEIKKLEKEQIAFEEQTKREEEQRKLQDMAAKILSSGKSLDEIEEFLKSSPGKVLGSEK